MTGAAMSTAVRRLYRGVEPGVVLTSLADLEERLDRLHDAARHDDDALLVTLQLGENNPADRHYPPTLHLVLGREWSALRYDSSALPEANFTSIGDPAPAGADSDDDIAVSWGDDYSYFSGQNVIPVEYAREAVRQFWPAGDRPDVCAWEA